MDITASPKRFSEKLADAIRSFTLLTFILLALVILLRLFELGYNLQLHSTKVNLLKLFGSALLTDLFFWFKFSILQLFIFLPLFFLSRKLSHIIFVSIVFIYLLFQFSITQYFSQSMVLLGADVYAYSLNDIRQTIGAAGKISVTAIAGCSVLLVCCLTAFYFIPKKFSIGKRVSFSCVMLSLVSVTMTSFVVVPQPSQGSEFLNNLALNKTDFFIAKSFQYFFPEENDIDIYADAYIGDYGSEATPVINFEYVDQVNYPFLHKDNAQDVLSPFFKKANQPPNIVILLVEGLGRAFTNEGAYLGNFTPFIDSLSNQSLYWENFLSEGGRTFAVLPSVVGSLPFLKNGFAEMGEKMPSHLSLVSLLKSNGYYTSFYYGGDSKFDNMQLFLQKSHIHDIYDEKSFGANYQLMPKSENGFSWGYGDKELFRKYFDTKINTSSRPFLNIILTVSMHTPFLINEQQQYLDKFEVRMQQLGFDEVKKKEYRDYRLQYASILYTDDAIKNFIHTYSTRADFSNTIFFITGDHRMPEIPMVSKIDRYHVPLLIYSPLLQRTAKFSSISTHFDITPSILAYIKANHPIQLPSLVSWMGTGLDTSRSFQNSHAYPLLQTKTDLVDFLAEDKFLNSRNLFKLEQGLRSAVIEDDAKITLMQHSFDEFKKKNDQVVRGAALLPDSIYNHYFPR